MEKFKNNKQDERAALDVRTIKNTDLVKSGHIVPWPYGVEIPYGWERFEGACIIKI